MTHVENKIYAKETRVVALAATLLSIAAFVWFYSRGEVLLYGDAVAHINIARRLFDSRSPGPLQLGTVWLPFPHLLTMPFVVNDWLWRTGVGGSIPSMIAFVLGAVGVFRLVRVRGSRLAAAMAAGIFGINPNLLYMQSTAMTETIFLATVIWSVVYLDEFVRRMADPTLLEAQGAVAVQPAAKALERCGMVLAASILTRYDGWVLAAICGAVVLVVLALRWKRLSDEAKRGVLRSAVDFYLLCALVPLLWLAQNYAIAGNPLDFANGPYSAKAIEQRTATAEMPGHPGKGDMVVAAIFFLKAAKLNVSWGAWERWMFAALLVGTALAIFRWRRHSVLLLLWFVVPFYAYSVAYGSVPIFMPVWWPHSYYNVRYGLELLPAFSVFIGLLIGAASALRWSRARWAVIAGAVALVGGSYLAAVRATPICLREARLNSVHRVALEARLGAELRKLPRESTLLMFTGSYVGALQREGIPLRRVVNEGVHPEWDYALADPAGYADYVVAVGEDPVWYAVRNFPAGLERVEQFDPEGKPQVTLYRSTRGNGGGGSSGVHKGTELLARGSARIQKNPF